MVEEIVYTTESLQDCKAEDGSGYDGPRGKTLFRNSCGELYEVFLCHGCQCCWQMDFDEEKAEGRVIDCGPHFLDMVLLRKD